MQSGMQQTLAQEWQKRMATRSGIVALLLTVPVLAAVVIGFSAGLGALPLGISALATGPDDPGVEPVAPSSADLNLTATPAAPASSPAAATGEGTGDASAASGTFPGTVATTPGVIPPSGSDLGGDGSGGSGGGRSGGGITTPVPGPVSSPSSSPTSAPVVNVPSVPGGGGAGEAVNGAVNNVGGAVQGVLEQAP